MKRKIYFFITLLFLSCKKDKISKNIYVKETKSNILYEINENKLIAYSFIDSIYSVKDKSLFLSDSDEYEIRTDSNDSIQIDFFHKKNIFLEKIDDFNDSLSIISLKKQGWFLNDKGGVNKYLFFDKDGLLYFIANPKKGKNNDNSFMKVEYIGKYFNKFEVYHFDSFVIPINLKNDSITFYIMNYIGNNSSELITYNRVKNNTIEQEILDEFETIYSIQ